MMADFIEAAVALLSDCKADIRACLTGVIQKGFAKVKLTPFFRETIAENFGVTVSQIDRLADRDVIALGLQSIDDETVKDAFRFHAKIVDAFWKEYVRRVA